HEGRARSAVDTMGKVPADGTRGGYQDGQYQAWNDSVGAGDRRLAFRRERSRTAGRRPQIPHGPSLACASRTAGALRPLLVSLGLAMGRYPVLLVRLLIRAGVKFQGVD